MKYLTILFLLLILSGCSNNVENKQIPKSEKINRAAQLFFKKYAGRNDWEGFLSLYDKGLIFRDILLQAEYDFKGFKKFYNWPDTTFNKHPDFPETIILEELTVNDSMAVGSGYFTPFYYQNVLYKPEKFKMEFTMRLVFNDSLKIIKHIDWVKYPPELLKGIAESQIKK